MEAGFSDFAKMRDYPISSGNDSWQSFTKSV